MPLFRGDQPFKRVPEPDLPSSTKVFHCNVTGEVFLTYQELFDRNLILDTSLWSCAVTKKDGLTYEEAVESEKAAHLGHPNYFKRPLLFFAKTYYSENNFDDLFNEVSAWIHQRYFLDEWVRYHVQTKGAMCKVIKIEYKKGKSPNPYSPKNYTYTVEVYDDIKGHNVQYQCGPSLLSRQQSCTTKKDIKNILMASLVENDDDFCSVIPEVLSELELQSASFDDFFVGPEPNFSFPSPKAKIAKTGKEVVLYVKNAEESKDTKETKVPGTSAYATKEKNAKLLRNQMQIERLNDWNFLDNLKDDADCNHTKDLPEFSNLALPHFVTNECFGQVLTIYAFLRAFKSELDLVGTFSFRVFLKALYSQGSAEFVKFMMALLKARNKCVAEEDFDEANVDQPRDIPDDYIDELNGEYGEEIKSRNKLLEEIRATFGKSLQQINVNQLNLTEFLKLTLKTAGFCPMNKSMAIRKEKRGQIMCSDDELFQFSLKNPHVVQQLEKESLTSLAPEDRLSLFNAFTLALLSYARFKTIHENIQMDLETLKDQIMKLAAIEIQIDGEFEDTERLFNSIEDFKFKRNGHSKKIEGYLESYRESPNLNKCLKIVQMKFRFDYFNEQDRILLYELHKKANMVKTKELVHKAQPLLKRIGGVCLGSDRHQQTYFYVPDLAIIFIECFNDEEVEWKFISEYKDVCQLMQALVPQAKREGRLLSALKLIVEHVGRGTEAFVVAGKHIFKYPISQAESKKIDFGIEDELLKSELVKFGDILHDRGFLNSEFMTSYSEWKQLLSDHGDTSNLHKGLNVILSYSDEIVVAAEKVAELTRLQRYGLSLFDLINNINLNVLHSPLILVKEKIPTATFTLANWMRSMLTISSESQLFFHLSTLHQMIKWRHRTNQRNQPQDSHRILRNMKNY